MSTGAGRCENHDPARRYECFVDCRRGYGTQPGLCRFLHGLDEALKHLSETHREVFVLRYQEELSIKEISEIMTCSEGTVKSRIFYALRKLSQRLQAFDPKEY